MMECIDLSFCFAKCLGIEMTLRENVSETSDVFGDVGKSSTVARDRTGGDEDAELLGFWLYRSQLCGGCARRGFPVAECFVGSSGRKWVNGNHLVGFGVRYLDWTGAKAIDTRSAVRFETEF